MPTIDEHASATVDPALVAFLADRDVFCPACHYNLRDLRVQTCPECGTAFELGLRGSMPGFRAWLTALILSCLAIGFCMLLVIGGAVEFILWGYFNPVELVLFAGFAAVLFASIINIIVLIRRRIRFWQRHRSQLTHLLVIAAFLFIAPIVKLIVLVTLVI